MEIEPRLKRIVNGEIPRSANLRANDDGTYTATKRTGAELAEG